MTDNSLELLDFVCMNCNSRETFEQSIEIGLTGRNFKESRLDSSKEAHNERMKYASLVHENMSDVLRRAAKAREIYGKKIVYEDDYDQICKESEKSSVGAGLNGKIANRDGNEMHVFEKRIKTEKVLKSD